MVPNETLALRRVPHSFDDAVDRLDLRVPGDHLHHVAALGGRPPREQRVGPQDVEHHLGREQ